MKTITVQVKSNYGQTVAYPVCTESKLFAKLAGTKTLTIDALKTIKALGFEVIQQAPQLLKV